MSTNKDPRPAFTEARCSVPLVDDALLIVESIAANDIRADLEAAAAAVNATARHPVKSINECLVHSGPILAAEVRRLRAALDKIEKGAVAWAISAEYFRMESSNLARALADAISTYGPADEVRVNAERIEAWQQVLLNSKAYQQNENRKDASCE